MPYPILVYPRQDLIISTIILSSLSLCFYHSIISISYISYIYHINIISISYKFGPFIDHSYIFSHLHLIPLCYTITLTIVCEDEIERSQSSDHRHPRDRFDGKSGGPGFHSFGSSRVWSKHPGKAGQTDVSSSDPCAHTQGPRCQTVG